MKRPLVLHVTESLGSGVANAIVEFAISATGYRHVIAGSWRRGAHIGDRVAAAAELIELSASPRHQPAAVWRLVKRLDPTLLHVHSSIAGVFVRAMPIRAVPIIYSPHCFAFERLDVSRAARSTFRSVERVLAHRTSGFIVVSPREMELAHKLAPGRPVFYVPNVVREVDGQGAHGERCDHSRLRLGMVGRICPQKGYDFFLAAVEGARSARMSVEWIWIGGGPPLAEAELRSRGVRVTGWTNRAQVLRELRQLDVYVHTAAWEGAPISLLEAAACGLPIVARRIPALESLGLSSLVDTPDELAAVAASHGDPGARARGAAESRRISARHTPEAQARALMHAYRLVAQEAPAAFHRRPLLGRTM